MTDEIVLIEKSDELVSWAEKNAEHIGLETMQAEILLGYMEGHDYQLGYRQNGSMVRVDVSEPEGEIQDYSLDEAIDIVCEWNYELILESSEKDDRYENLRHDEMILDAMFDRTSYGKKIEEIAGRLADELIAKLSDKKDISECVKDTVDKVRNLDKSYEKIR